ncbi:hypothetical protein V6R21_30700 [Limibacter armeniacum]|uniref:hypothetical protein n=1 Tax=Limibacter armeniacum TaxID=466084 RepID=UPI002FE6020D
MSINQMALRKRQEELERLQLKRDSILCDYMKVNIRIRKIEMKRRQLEEAYSRMETLHKKASSVMVNGKGSSLDVEIDFYQSRYQMGKIERFYAKHSDWLLAELKAKERGLKMMADELTAVCEALEAELNKTEEPVSSPTTSDKQSNQAVSPPIDLPHIENVEERMLIGLGLGHGEYKKIKAG